ncbi:MAG: hypothetical protein C0403_10890 [Desulfobacterium sp.]|nr:hypothetical protein [Desulfobacterium sp.]
MNQKDSFNTSKKKIGIDRTHKTNHYPFRHPVLFQAFNAVKDKEEKKTVDAKKIFLSIPS